MGGFAVFDIVILRYCAGSSGARRNRAGAYGSTRAAASEKNGKIMGGPGAGQVASGRDRGWPAGGTPRRRVSRPLAGGGQRAGRGGQRAGHAAGSPGSSSPPRRERSTHAH